MLSRVGFGITMIAALGIPLSLISLFLPERWSQKVFMAGMVVSTLAMTVTILSAAMYVWTTIP